ncbi:MAG TPA: VTT domain-containing protein [Pyrinomonadaceae bacterium]|nr:VTT domain-containing protein [Pyrinomonadaceae bacterium]
MDSHPFYELIGNYGLYAVFLLAMIEGDITLLLAGVLAHSGFFGEYSLAKVIFAGTLGGVAGDNVAYGMGRGFGIGARNFRFYRVSKPRIERLTEKFGPLSIFLSKYVYGLRTASCVFYGVGRMPYVLFLPLAFASCLAWVLTLSCLGYFFSGAITGLLGDFHQIGILLLIIVVLGIIGFYLAERFWFSKKIEEADPELIQEIEHAAQEKLHEIKEEIQERIHLPQLPHHKDSPKRKRTSEHGGAKGD